MRQMIATGILLCIILLNCFGGIDGVGEEADNGKKDLLFGQMWRKAFEANRHNGKEGEEKEMPKEVKKEPKEEKDEEEEKEIKLWKKVKKEPIDDKLKVEEEEEERGGKRRPKKIKKEPKFEENEWEDLLSKSKTKENDLRQDKNSASDQNDMNQLARQMEAEEKWKIIKKFDKMRKECKKKKGYTNEMRGIIERKIAKKLYTYRDKIYEWKKELKGKKECEERKRDIIEKFDKMRNEYKMKKDYKSEDQCKIERGIARELGTYRAKIYAWKKEFAKSKLPEKCINEQKGQIIDSSSATDSEERKRKIIENFDRMRKEYKNKKDYNKREDRNKMEQEIAKALGISRKNIYKWKKEQSQRMGPKNKESEKEKFEIIEKFERMRKECQMKKDYKNENRIKMEQEIAKALGTYRDKIYEWKKEQRQRNGPENEERKELGTNRANIYEWKKALTPSRAHYTKEQKRAIIAKFDKVCKEFSNNFHTKPTIIIEKKIAKKLHICHSKIYMWKKAFEKDEA